MAKIKILSIDDSSIIRTVIKNSLEPIGFDVREANDGVEGLAVLAKEHDTIQLILLDWNMPGMNGFEFLKKVKADHLFARIPVMMVTTESEKAAIVKALQAGVANYLLKPFKTDELIKKANMCLVAGAK